MEKENPVLDFIRKNIPLKRVVEVEKRIPSLEEYANKLTETVYRSHRGSIKVDFSKARGDRLSLLNSLPTHRRTHQKRGLGILV